MRIKSKSPCPICEREDYDYIYVSDVNDKVIGCTECVFKVEGWTYTEEVEEQSISEHINACIDAALGK